jgi:hypothetical protein
MKVQTRQFRVIRKEGVVDQEGRVVPVPTEDDDGTLPNMNHSPAKISVPSSAGTVSVPRTMTVHVQT